MPVTQLREIIPASRLENVRYAIRDLACIADEVAREGHKILPLNIGDPLNFDFQTPAHMIEAVYQAMRDGKNGYSPSSGIPPALAAIRGEAARKALESIGLGLAVVNLGRGEDAPQKAVAEAFDAFANARNFGDVYPGAENHRSIVNWQFVIGNFDFCSRYGIQHRY